MVASHSVQVREQSKLSYVKWSREETMYKFSKANKVYLFYIFRNDVHKYSKMNVLWMIVEVHLMNVLRNPIDY